ncbi:GNAT family N-acetyltransferase [Maribacter hydrothermalis]|uniref:Acetyltransferase n=1 Tax=Maribacter hydrothermalis TaxID=1836467 RepID=A0A1B7Z7W4_9FLAO|nr:GNAT family N-acetyltransferase [Maribacter hydrothermalis]APQ15828.1 GNAT family N-acetyltransferase [Maribacter hydrothermalis]OBR38793.1 acetyltransferase [Maribacter hydrothermalis]
MINIKKITGSQVADIYHLFDNYRVFYKMKSDTKAAAVFLDDRMLNEESIIFAAYSNKVAIGFVQLYFTFSSVSLEKSLLLNDLFVDSNFRNKSVGKALLLKSQEYCRINGYKGLALETAIDNPAQKLYEKLGWLKDNHCFHYFWQVK